MKEKILFVDDEPNVLDGIRRGLRKAFEISTAPGAQAGLDLIEREGPFAVVVSDMRMPEMNGAQFLTKVRERNPECVRMVLSGESDLDAAIAAVNDGSIFRFLRKPCGVDVLTRGVELAIEQHRLIVAEKELLERTLNGCVQMLTEILAMANPDAFSQAKRIRENVDAMIERLEIRDAWEYRIAALLSQIGCIALPAETVAKKNEGKHLSDLEQRMLGEHPGVAARLLGNIPRLERVARMVAGQLDPVDPASASKPPLDWAPAVLGAQMLRVVAEFDRLQVQGLSKGKAIGKLRESASKMPLALVDVLENAAHVNVSFTPRALNAVQLRPGMKFDADVVASTGVLLARKGQEVTDAMITRLKNFSVGVGLQEPLNVLVPE